MIHELRTYTFHPGKLPEYLKVAEEVGRPVRGNDYGLNLGYWTSDSGPLNQIWHIWQYESFDEREALRQKLAKNEAWRNEYIAKIRDLVEKREIRFLRPAQEFSPPSSRGNIYELRHYQCRSGDGRYLKHLKEIMPVRAKYSQPVGLWQVEAPLPNNVIHMWAYDDMNARTEVQIQVAQDPKWQKFLEIGAPLLASMESIILLPTNFSPAR